MLLALMEPEDIEAGLVEPRNQPVPIFVDIARPLKTFTWLI
jgi:hypothetical protein